MGHCLFPVKEGERERETDRQTDEKKVRQTESIEIAQKFRMS